jgi:hypothetical protein
MLIITFFSCCIRGSGFFGFSSTVMPSFALDPGSLGDMRSSTASACATASSTDKEDSSGTFDAAESVAEATAQNGC